MTAADVVADVAAASVAAVFVVAVAIVVALSIVVAASIVVTLPIVVAAATVVVLSIVVAICVVELLDDIDDAVSPNTIVKMAPCSRKKSSATCSFIISQSENMRFV